MLFFSRENYKAYKALDTYDLELFFNRFGISSSYSTEGFNNGGLISEGMFIVKSLRTDNNIALSEVSWPNALRYIHFSNKKLSNVNIPSGTDTAWTYKQGIADPHSPCKDQFGLVYNNVAGYNGALPIAGKYEEDSFNTSINRLYPNTEIEGSLNTHAMYYANTESEGGIPGSVKCKIESYTFDNEDDLWSHDSNGNVRDLPAIVKLRDRYDNEEISVSHIQQASFIINAASTDINDIGSATWKKENHIFYETLSDYTHPIGDVTDIDTYNNATYYHHLYKYNSYYRGNTYRQITSNYYDYSGSDAPIMLDVIIKTGYNTELDHQNFSWGVSKVTTTNTCNFHRNELPLMDDNDTISNFKQTKAFRGNGNNWWYGGDASGYELDDPDHLICIPVIFSKLSTQANSSYGYNNAYKSNANSYKNIFGLANLAASSFGGSYNKFSIYATTHGSSNFIISYAIDLRNFETKGAVAGQTQVSNMASSTDVLLIANRNIYVLSVNQINNYIHDINT